MGLKNKLSNQSKAISQIMKLYHLNIFLKHVIPRVLLSFKKTIHQSTLGRSLSTVSGRTKDDTNSNVISSPTHIDPVVGVTVPEFLWSNLHKWENEKAFVSKSKHEIPKFQKVLYILYAPRVVQ